MTQLEQFIEKYNPTTSTVYFSSIRFNYLNKNYTLVMEFEQNDVSEVEFFDGKTIQETIESFEIYLTGKVRENEEKIESFSEGLKEYIS